VTSSGWKGTGPAFLLGSALAVGAQVSAGLLLYGGPGFLPALAVILAVTFFSLGAGLAAPPPVAGGETLVEEARRRWLFTLLAFTLAAAFSAGWEIFRGFGALGATQAMGLAVLSALPAWTGGRTLAMIAHLARLEGVRGPAFPALSGAATGALALAWIFFPTLSPTAVILVALLAVSSGALLHGLALDEGVRVEPLPRWEIAPGRWEVERWIRPASRTVRVAARVDGRLRVLREGDGRPVLAEERALEGDPRRWGEWPERVLALGVGAAVAAAALGRGGTPLHLRVVDPHPHRIEELLAALDWSGDLLHLDPVAMDPATLLQRGAGPLPDGGADWVLVDALALAPTPAAARIPPGGLLRLREWLRPGGLLAVLPLEEGAGAESLLERFHGVRGVFPRAALYLGPKGGEPLEAVPPSGGWPRFPLGPAARSGFLVAARDDGAEWPESVDGFLRVTVGG
jgi:hypothetical protein